MRPGLTIWFTGLSGAGKTTLSHQLGLYLKQSAGREVEILDGDVVRSHLSKGLGFSKEDRDTNILRIGWVAGLLTRHGVIVLVAAISPYRDARDRVRKAIEEENGKGSFIEIYVEAPLKVCELRDPKGLYRKARAGEIRNFTGLDDPYEPPRQPDIHLRTDRSTPQECLDALLAYLNQRRLLPSGA
jgi:adenylylsulfate kinase